MTRHADTRQPTPARAPRVGLLAAAVVTEGMGSVRWGKGVDWLPELHPTTSEGYGARAVDCDAATVEHGSDDKAVIEKADPFAVYAFDWCTWAERDRDWQGRARRLLEATQSHSIAKELWGGAIAAAVGNVNVWFAKQNASTALDPGTVTPAVAVELVDEYLADALTNGRGAMHVTPRVLGRLVANDMVVRENGQWFTPMGNIVIADGGYSGAYHGDAGPGWVYASTVPEIVLGPVEVTSLEAGGGSFDHSNNDVKVWAQRDVLVMHEPNLALARVEIALS